MNRKQPLIALLIAGLLGAGGYGLYAAGTQHGLAMARDEPTPGTVAAAPDVSNWSVQQGSDATVRHLRDGLKAGDPHAGQIALHGHDDGAGLCGQRRRG